MKGILNIEMRISRDGAGKLRFTKEEVEALVKSENIVFHKNLLLKKDDRKVVGEIKKYTML